jgi:hypothetical protein
MASPKADGNAVTADTVVSAILLAGIVPDKSVASILPSVSTLLAKVLLIVPIV